jgi:DNA-binding MarR family transcriptional regulator
MAQGLPAAEEVGSPASSSDEIVLGLLDSVERNPTLTQRSVARDLGIALGLANAYLKRCVRKGLIKVSEVPTRRFAYYLTPQGFAEKSRLTSEYLSHSFSFFRRARAECEAIFAEALARGQRRVALVGPGDLAEIARVVAPEYPIELVGVIPGLHDVSELKAAAARFGSVDAVIVTALVEPWEVFTAALGAFGTQNVYAPPLLRMRRPVEIQSEAAQ